MEPFCYNYFYLRGNADRAGQARTLKPNQYGRQILCFIEILRFVCAASRKLCRCNLNLCNYNKCIKNVPV